jgi:S-DNA-T family DNA segregation ATPase FtsK/SpoIIIE
MRERLAYMADRIEAVLSLHRISSRVTGGTVTPRWIRFQVLPAPGTKMSKIKGLSDELAVALDTSNCQVSRRGAAVDIEVSRDDPLPVRLLPLYRQFGEEGVGTIPPATAILGLAEDGAPLLIRLPSPDVAHILITGAAGAGKTTLLQAIVLSLALANPAPGPLLKGGGLALVLVDFSGRAFGSFDGLPHLPRPVICDTDEAIEALQSLIRLMDRRLHAGESERGSCPKSRTIIAIDELADLLAAASGTVFQALTRLTQRGREAGIHVIAATREIVLLESLRKTCFPVRLVGQVASATDARAATGWSSTGAERLAGHGDFLAVAEGGLIRLHAAHVSAEEIAEVLACLTQAKAQSAPVTLPWPPGQLAQLSKQV